MGNSVDIEITKFVELDKSGKEIEKPWYGAVGNDDYCGAYCRTARSIKELKKQIKEAGTLANYFRRWGFPGDTADEIAAAYENQLEDDQEDDHVQ